MKPQRKAKQMKTTVERIIEARAHIPEDIAKAQAAVCDDAINAIGRVREMCYSGKNAAGAYRTNAELDYGKCQLRLLKEFLTSICPK
jgi:hypothetical protein